MDTLGASKAHGCLLRAVSGMGVGSISTNTLGASVPPALSRVTPVLKPHETGV
jgi:hypothetical protein